MTLNHYKSVGLEDALPDIEHETVRQRLRRFFTLNDGRFEDLEPRMYGRIGIFRDIMSALIVSFVAIPLSMGFSLAIGLNPAAGIATGAVCGFMGFFFSSSKYAQYGSTAALIPTLSAITSKYPDPAVSMPLLVVLAIIAGIICMALGLFGLGSTVQRIPHCIVVGFTFGIGVVIALSESGDTFGFNGRLPSENLGKLSYIVQHWNVINWYSVMIAIMVFVISKGLIYISIYIPGPLIAIAMATLLSETVLSGQLVRVCDRFGNIPASVLHLDGPALPSGITLADVGDLAYRTIAIVLVCAIESLLSAKMADKMAENVGHQFEPNKELFGQGWILIGAALLGGFPCTGALARSATNVKLGGISPFVALFKGVFKLLLTAAFASYLDRVPLSCIAGLLLFVALNMCKVEEIKQIMRAGNKLHIFLLFWTALLVIVFDFSTGVCSAIAIWLAATSVLGMSDAIPEELEELLPPLPVTLIEQK